MNVVRLAGVALPAFGPLGWSFTAGTRPHMRGFEMSKADAEQVARTGGTDIEVELRPVGRDPLHLKKLCFVRLAQGSRPDTRRVILADRRWLWARRMVHRDYNVRRRTGDTVMDGEGTLIRVENQTERPDIVYAAWSLKGKRTAWTVAEVLADVLTVLGGEIQIPPGLKRTIEIEDLSLADPGDVALEKVLAFAAGYSLRLDAEGRAHIFDTRDRAEIRAISDAGTPLRLGSAFHALTDRSWSRPSSVRVLFDREAELRFDYIEGEATTTVRNDPDPPRRLENILPVPDVSIVIAGKKCSRGTWVNIDDYLAALEATNAHAETAGNGPLTHVAIRRHWCSNWDRVMSNTYGIFRANQVEHPLWRKRLAAIRRHWRQTFRPLKQWRDKLRSLKPYRVAVRIDELGARAPSEVYMDYVAKPAASSLHKSVSQNPDLGRQVSGWRANLSDPTAETAPAEVTVVDDEAGIFSVHFRADPWGEVESYAPGNVANLPKRKVTGQLRDASGVCFGYWGEVPLLPTFKLAVILTAMQASPNSEAKMHVVEVDPGEAQTVLGQPIGACKGEPWTVAVGGGLETARTAWLDAHAGSIDQAFFNGGPFPDALLLDGDNLKARARAEAARLYGTMLDREEGSVVVAWNPKCAPVGAISIVDHAIDPSGVAVTSIAVFPEMEPVNAMGFIPASVQRVIRRMVQP